MIPQGPHHKFLIVHPLMSQLGMHSLPLRRCIPCIIFNGNNNFNVLLCFIIHDIIQWTFLHKAIIWKGNTCSFKTLLELKLRLATFDVDAFCLNVVWVTANASLSHSKMGTPLDHTNPPLGHFMAHIKVVALVLQWIEAVVHRTTGVSDSHSIDHNYPHLPLKFSGSKNCPNVCTIASILFIAPLNVRIWIECGGTSKSSASWLPFDIWVKEIGHYISKI